MKVNLWGFLLVETDEQDVYRTIVGGGNVP